MKLSEVFKINLPGRVWTLILLVWGVSFSYSLSAKEITSEVTYSPSQINGMKSAFQYHADPFFTSGIQAGIYCGVSTATVSVGVDRLINTQVNASGPVKLVLQIRGYEAGSSTHFIQEDVEFIVDHRNTITGNRDVLQTYSINGVYKVGVKVLSLKIGATNINCPANVFVKVGIESRRNPTLSLSGLNLSHTLLDLNASPQAITGTNINTSYPLADEMLVSWNSVDAAVLYELEWTYVNNYKSGVGTYYSATEMLFNQSNFEHNSTRISTSQTNYRIPLLYDKGFVIYRLRVLYHADCFSERLDQSSWSASICGETTDKISCFSPNYQKVDGHFTDMNWQVSTSFAEGGKKKEAISYFDGSKRNRQTVVRNNTDDVSLVSEPIYDYQGRPAIQFLPAPGAQEIKYHDHFNRKAGLPYSPLNFDLDAIDPCAIEVDFLGTGVGASNYYSPSNPDQSGMNAYLPDAKKYPFVQTEYEPDNTGRIRRQSGVGEDYMLGTGRETKYFYSTPDPEEIDALFGTDVGYASHYQKTVVVDPNQQVTLTYKDMSGKVIASGMTGVSPSSVEPLKNSSGDPLYTVPNSADDVQMLGKEGGYYDVDDEDDRNFPITEGTGLLMNYNLVFPKTMDFSADYYMHMPAYTDACLSNRAYEPVFDLNIAVFDPGCQEMLLNESSTQGVYQTNSSGVLYSRNVSGDDFDNLPAGTYNITKKWTLDEDVMEEYANQYIQDATSCLIPYTDFLNTEKGKLDYSDCDGMLSTGDLGFDECIDNLGDPSNYSSQAEYNALVKECKEAFTAISMCEVIYDAMLSDVSPGGQYGQVEADDNGVYFSTDRLSVFNTNSDPDNLNLLPEFWGVDPIPNVLSGTGQLTIHDMISNWDPDWAHNLVQYHPEYKYYNIYMDEYCDGSVTLNGISTQEYDWLLQNTQIAAAVDDIDEYLNFSGTLSWTYTGGASYPILNNDPLWTYSVFGPAHKPEMVSMLSNYSVNGQTKNIYEYAAYMARCSNWYGDNGGSCPGMTATFGVSSDTHILNKEWNFLKSLYLEAKYKYLYNVANKDAILETGVKVCNTCIGDNDFNPFWYFQFRYLIDPGLNSQASNCDFSCLVDEMVKQKVCGITASFYKEKDRRFAFHDVYNPSTKNSEDEDEEKDDADQEIYEKTGLCPMTTELKNLIGDIGAHYDMTQNVSLLKVGGFTHTLYRLVSGFPYISNESCGGCYITNYAEYTWTPTIQNGGSRLNVSLTPTSVKHYNSPGGGPYAATRSQFMKLDFQSGSAYNWYSSFTIKRVRQVVPNAALNTGNYYGFAAEIEFVDATGNTFVEVLNGFIDGVNLDNCAGTFSSNMVAHASKQSGELEGLLNLLIANNQIESSSYVDLQSDPYRKIFEGSEIKANLDNYNPSPASNYNWLRPSTSAPRYIIRTTGDDVKYRIFLPTTNNNTFTAPDIYVRNLKPIEPGAAPPLTFGQHTPNFQMEVVSLTGTPQVESSVDIVYAYIDAYDNAGINSGAVGVTFTPDLGYTGSPLQQQPNEPCSDYAPVRLDVQKLLNSTMPTFGSAYLYDPNWPQLSLISKIAFDQLPPPVSLDTGALPPGGATYIAGDEVPGHPSRYMGMLYYGHGLHPDGTLTYDDELGEYVWDYENTNAEGVIDCDINFEFVDSVGHRFDDVQAIVQLRGIPGTFVDGVTNQFIAVAVMSDGTTAEIIGETCAQFSECVECTEVPPLVPTNCWSDYQDFMEFVVNPLGLEDYQGDFSQEDFCNMSITCMEDYIDYIQALDVSSESSPYYVPVSEFCNRNMGYYLQSYKQYVSGIVGGSASSFSSYLPGTYTNQFVLLRDFAINGVGYDCLDDYTNYYSSTSNPIDVIQYCSGVGYDYPCPRISFNPLPKIELTENPCDEHYDNLAKRNADAAYDSYIKDEKFNFKERYKQHALSNSVESFTRDNSGIADYHFTLYYYDQAGNLIQTIPPKGVNRLSGGDLQTVQQMRKDNSGDLRPNHDLSLATKYHYNSLNQVVQQSTPDGGLTQFWYDRVGRLVLSQNEEQASATTTEYSYTRFDGQGRVVEVGKVATSQTIDDGAINHPEFPYNLATSCEEVTLTYYDDVHLDEAQDYYMSLDPLFRQENLMNRVSAVAYYPYVGEGTPPYDFATHYSYDIHGNVKTVIQDFKSHFNINEGYKRFKRIDYSYDLVSGNVNQVTFQGGCNDQFIHKYQYDGDNRIEAVFTSRDGRIWDRDATYDYYKHGPLARTVVGEAEVQGIDYAYTLQGWLKTVNASTLNPVRDIGKDGNGAGNTVRDAFGFSLHYNSSDYSPISTSANAMVANTASMSLKNLYNGNIGGMVTSIWDNTETPMKTHGNKYTYDQLNRLVGMKVYKDMSTGDNVLSSNSFASASQSTDYQVGVVYDANGNITSLQRNGFAATGQVAMDNLSYTYYPNSNRLKRVQDSGPAGNTYYGTDLENQTATTNYTYDAIGNLIEDAGEEIEEIVWTISGKISEIKRYSTSSKSDLKFEYDGMGNRVVKIEKPNPTDPATWKYTFYVRDASGNVMGVYKSDNNTPLSIEEFSIYGSDRLGVMNIGEEVEDPAVDPQGGSSGPEGDCYGLAFALDPVEEYSVYQDCGEISNNSQFSSIGGQLASFTLRAASQDVSLSAALGVTLSVNGVQVSSSYVIPAGTIVQVELDGLVDIGLGVDFEIKPLSTNLSLLLYGHLTTKNNVITHSKWTAGDKNYELKNHLGNVLATVADYKYWGDFLSTTELYSVTFDDPDDTKDWDIKGPVNVKNSDGMLTITPEDKEAGVGYGFTITEECSYQICFTFTEVNPEMWLRIYADSKVLYDYELRDPEQLCFELELSIGENFYFEIIGEPGGMVTLDDITMMKTCTSNEMVADVLSAQDYYPFGSTMPGRVFNSGDYRYGFNGKEMDNEVSGNGNQYDYGFRIYNPRIGRFLSVDPLFKSYPWYTPYQFAGNIPIAYVDRDGLEGMQYMYLYHGGKAALNAVTDWATEKHAQGVQLVNMTQTVQDNTNFSLYEKGLLYVAPYFWDVAPQTSQNDVAVLGTGKHLDGSEASTFDKFLAGGFVLLPVSGQLVKKSLKYVDNVFDISSELLDVASYLGKHAPSSKTPWKKIVESTKNGPAKFAKEVDIDKVTREAWDNGSAVNNGKSWKVYDAGETVGASSGKETQYMRVELTESTGELHSSPITQQQYDKLTKSKN